MIKLFEHVSTYHRTTETLTIKECGQGLYVGVNSCEIIPSERVGELNYDEQTTSIVVPLSEITNLIQSLSKVASGWIDASERLPESECFYLVRLFDGHRDEHVFVILWWNSEHQQFLEWDAMCEPTHWMPIPEFSTMQNLHKGE